MQTNMQNSWVHQKLLKIGKISKAENFISKHTRQEIIVMKPKESEVLNNICFEPIFNVGDYITPIKKSIFCELNDIGLIMSVDENTYSIKTKGGMERVHIQFQEYYRRVIPNKQQEL